jgi:hypothetical protein
VTPGRGVGVQVGTPGRGGGVQVGAPVAGVGGGVAGHGSLLYIQLLISAESHSQKHSLTRRHSPLPLSLYLRTVSLP